MPFGYKGFTCFYRTKIGTSHKNTFLAVDADHARIDFEGFCVRAFPDSYIPLWDTFEEMTEDEATAYWAEGEKAAMHSSMNLPPR